MSARAALIRPSIAANRPGEHRDVDAEARVEIYRRNVTLAREHRGIDDHGLVRVRQFTRWHLGFWCREMPRRSDGSVPSMQVREMRAESHRCTRC